MEENYVIALLEEIKIQGENFGDRVVDTVYFGGGTPSVLPVGQLKKIVDELNDNFCLKTIERSIEGNPESLTREKLQEYRDCGFNRVSIGVQSLDDEVLKTAGRLHNSKTAIVAIENAIEIIGNVSVDIMLGLPKQTFQSAVDTADSLMNYDLKHISCYSLKLEENTPLALSVSRGDLILPNEDITTDMFDAVSACIVENGYSRYEVSNFAKNGYECKHNIGYWDREEYLGLGASAHSLINETRFSNIDNVSKYIDWINEVKAGKQDYNHNITALTKTDIRFERIMLGLRKTCGIPKSYFRGYEKQLEKFADFFISTKENNIALTKRGFEIMNSILCEFIED